MGDGVINAIGEGDAGDAALNGTGFVTNDMSATTEALDAAEISAQAGVAQSLGNVDSLKTSDAAANMDLTQLTRPSLSAPTSVQGFNAVNISALLAVALETNGKQNRELGKANRQLKLGLSRNKFKLTLNTIRVSKKAKILQAVEGLLTQATQFKGVVSSVKQVGKSRKALSGDAVADVTDQVEHAILQKKVAKIEGSSENVARKDNLSKAENDLGDVNTKIGDVDQKISKNSSDVETNDKAQKDTGEQIQDVDTKIGKKTGEIEGLESTVKKVETEDIPQAKKKIEGLEGELTQLKKGDGIRGKAIQVTTGLLEAAGGNVSGKKADKAQAHGDLASAQDRLGNANTAVKGLKTELKSLKVEKKALVAEVADLTGKKTTADADLGDAKKKLAPAEAAEEGAGQAVKKLETDMGALDTEIAKLKAAAPVAAATPAKAKSTEALEAKANKDIMKQALGVIKGANVGQAVSKADLADPQMKTKIDAIAGNLGQQNSRRQSGIKSLKKQIGELERDGGSFAKLEIKNLKSRLASVESEHAKVAVAIDLLKGADISISNLSPTQAKAFLNPKTVDAIKNKPNTADGSAADGSAAKIAQLEAQKAALGGDLTTAKATHETAKATLGGVKTDIASKTTAANQAGNKLGDAQANLNNIQSKITAVKTELVPAKKLVHALNNEVTALKEKIGGLNSDIKGAEGVVSGLRDQINGLRTNDNSAAIASKKAEIAGAKGALNDLKAGLDNTKQQLGAAKIELGGLKTKKAGLESKAGRLSEEGANLKTEGTALKGEAGGLSTQKTELEGKIGKLKVEPAEMTKIRKRLAELESQGVHKDYAAQLNVKDINVFKGGKAAPSRTAKKITALKQSSGRKGRDVGAAAAQGVRSLIANIKSAPTRFAKTLDAAPKNIGASLGRSKARYNKKKEAVRTAISKVPDTLRAKKNDAKESLKAVGKAISTKVSDVRTAISKVPDTLRTKKNDAKESLKAVGTAISTKVSDVRTAISTKASDVRTAISKVPDTLRTKKNDAKESLKAVGTAISTKVSDVRTAISTKASDASASIGKGLTKLASVSVEGRKIQAQENAKGNGKKGVAKALAFELSGYAAYKSAKSSFSESLKIESTRLNTEKTQTQAQPNVGDAPRPQLAAASTVAKIDPSTAPTAKDQPNVGDAPSPQLAAASTVAKIDPSTAPTTKAQPNVGDAPRPQLAAASTVTKIDPSTAPTTKAQPNVGDAPSPQLAGAGPKEAKALGVQ
ncbi:MAG: chromosome segregation ATPase, partial [Halioglobus sp.]